MEGINQYCVLWNNYHNYLADTIQNLQREDQLVDVTLVTTDGFSMNAHQVVLAACSSFFRNFIRKNTSKHPFILLPSDIGTLELRAMIEFMYTGQVCIQQDKLQDFIKGARYFRIKGLEESAEDSDKEDFEGFAENNFSEPFKHTAKKQKIIEEITAFEEEADHMRTTIKGKAVKDHRYTQQADLGDSDDNRGKWEVIDRKPIIIPHSKTSPGKRKKRRKLTVLSKSPMHLSNDVICYQRKNRLDDGRSNKDEPINKVRRPGYLHEDEVDICTCSSKKIWGVNDTEALLKAWMETLNQVPPSYFIRSVSLCRRVSKNLQQMGVQKNWKQCQVKMKNLRREVRLYKESIGKAAGKKASEVALTCEKLLPIIENIFEKEQGIRREWYERKGQQERGEALDRAGIDSTDILARVAALAEADLNDDDDDTDTHFIEAEGVVESEVGYPSGDDPFVSDQESSGHQIHNGQEGTVVHHIVEAITDHPLSK